MNSAEPELEFLASYLYEAQFAPVEDTGKFAPYLARLGDHPRALREAGELLLKSYHVGSAAQCFERALQLAPDHAETCFRLASALLQLRRVDEAMATIVNFANDYQVSSPTVIEHICNQALWLGRHRAVAGFISDTTSWFDTSVLSNPNSYFVDAMLTYASESDEKLFTGMAGLFRHRIGAPVAHLEQYCNSGLPPDSDVLFASHSYAGTSAIVNLLLLAGLRVDEVGRRWAPGYPIDDATELRAYATEQRDELPARLLHRYFPVARGKRCYAYSHRLPNPENVGNRLTIFLIRDPRTSLTTWAKPTVNHVELGTFRRFASIHAQDWCRFVDAIEQTENKWVIRFEDWQRTPLQVASALLDRIGHGVRESQVKEAIHFSGTHISRVFRALNAQMHGTDARTNPDVSTPPATPDMLRRDHTLISEICGTRLDRHGYPREYGSN